MNWQNRFLLLVLPILVFSVSVYGVPAKVATPNASEILRFTLFNYDNLISDGYEKRHDTIDQLAYLLHKATTFPTANFTQILRSDELRSETDPVHYMVILNQKTKGLCGRYFVDD